MVHKPFVFKDANKLYEMAMLRRAGWAISNLSELFNCDRTSLRFQCRKYVIIPIPDVQFEMKRVVRNTLASMPEFLVQNRPKMYRDYLPKNFSWKYYSKR